MNPDELLARKFADILHQEDWDQERKTEAYQKAIAHYRLTQPDYEARVRHSKRKAEHPVRKRHPATKRCSTVNLDAWIDGNETKKAKQ